METLLELLINAQCSAKITGSQSAWLTVKWNVDWVLIKCQSVYWSSAIEGWSGVSVGGFNEHLMADTCTFRTLWSQPDSLWKPSKDPVGSNKISKS